VYFVGKRNLLRIFCPTISLSAFRVIVGGAVIRNRASCRTPKAKAYSWKETLTLQRPQVT